MISPRAGNLPQALTSCPVCTTVLIVAELGGRDRLVCEVCEFVHWDNPKPVTATLVPMESGIVLVKRKYEPYVGDWCLPGGFMEAREEPEESAQREVFEETGLNVEIDRLVGAHSPGKGINVIILFYLAKPATGLMVAGDDASEVASFTKDSLPANVAFELHRRMIEQFFDNFNT